MGKQFRHADRRGQRWVIVAGADEEARKEVAVKDLDSASKDNQETIALEDLVGYLKGKMG